jgi:hypothetical protein
MLAAQLEDPVAKEATLRIADEHDRLAVRATKRMADAPTRKTRCRALLKETYPRDRRRRII